MYISLIIWQHLNILITTLVLGCLQYVHESRYLAKYVQDAERHVRIVRILRFMYVLQTT